MSTTSGDGGGAPAPAEARLLTICGHLLRRAQQVHNAHWADELGAELTSPQYAVLATLAAWPEIDQRRVGELASLDKSSTMDLVERLERKAWITRRRDVRDGRRDVLALTASALLALGDLGPRVRHVQERMLAPLADDLRARFIADLGAISRVSPAPEAGDTSPLRIPGHLIRRAQQVHTALFADEFDHELTGPQYATLHVLAREPGISQRTLGERAALDKSTTADIVDRLSRRGWLVAQRDTEDRRRSVLTLTDDARAATAEFAPRVEAVQARLLDPLPPAHRTAFLSALRRVAIPSLP